MNALVQRSIAVIQQSRRSAVPWKLDEPWKQDHKSFSDGGWSPYGFGAPAASGSISSMALYSWNIDFMLPYAESRLRQALSHLQKLVTSLPKNRAAVIFLQESTKSDLELLTSHDWVRECFYLSDLDTSNWTSSHYGTVTLVDKRLTLADSFRIHYKNTNMERDAFFTDIRLHKNSQIIRLCNSHLESMAFDPPMRPHQIALAAKYMHDAPAAVIAGDFNAIQDFDRHLHTDNDLKDAYLELGGTEDSDAGYTWGQQAATYQRDQFGCSRMDKVFYCGVLQLKSFERFGADVFVEAENEKAEITALGFDKPWITDHLGVKAVFEVRDVDEKL